ncbi:sensor histidine kinase [Alicyclobacillus tolerans]|uniref:histidine kinase n=1 Tax=Alicyclobacillus tolerans TaxID=90970 RepID=A0ABT9LWS8_9BACL|nr:ATP-binding protein [Alicyclobacillus tengchongensis]MDP9728631.1 two-component system phosphate regulon sensor histidine kinase PhoR [Alicyclobacillus tengchongensis]
MIVPVMLAFFAGMVTPLIVFGIRRRWGKYFMEYLQDSLDAFGNGDYSLRMYEYLRRGFNREIANSFNQMTSRIETVVDELSAERDVLEHILHNMTTGIIYITRGGTIEMVNEAAQLMFRKPLEHWTKQDHWSLFRNYHLGAAIDNALLFGTPWQSELNLRDTQTVLIRLVPVPSKSKTAMHGEVAFDVLMLCNDVTEFRRLERMRSEFVANVSHELKTPIAAIRGFAETLLDDEAPAEVQKQFLQTIYDESNRMNALVSDLLELSRLEAEEHRIQLLAVPLMDVVERALDRLTQVALARQIQLELEPFEPVNVWAEDDLLLQVFLNLMSNAIHYTPSGGKVTIRCEILVDRVKVHVIDTGIGIAPEHLDRLFERFYRVNRDRSRASGGTGLGLSIVKHIVTALGGEVGVESEVGKGSDFWFTLSRMSRLPEDKSLSMGGE